MSSTAASPIYKLPVELLERILLELPLEDLISARHVCVHLSNVLSPRSCSQKLQRAQWLLLNGEVAAGKDYALNPLIDRIFQGKCHVWTHFDGHMVLEFKPHNPFTRLPADGMWTDMLVVQPRVWWLGLEYDVPSFYGDGYAEVTNLGNGGVTLRDFKNGLQRIRGQLAP